MTTFYRDFQGQRSVEAAIEFCIKRGHLGHNTRRLRLDDEWTRVYFSPSFVDIERAIEAKHEAKK